VYYFTLGKPQAYFILETKRSNRDFTFSAFHTILLNLNGSRDCFTKYAICTSTNMKLKLMNNIIIIWQYRYTHVAYVLRRFNFEHTRCVTQTSLLQVFRVIFYKELHITNIVTIHNHQIMRKYITNRKCLVLCPNKTFLCYC